MRRGEGAVVMKETGGALEWKLPNTTRVKPLNVSVFLHFVSAQILLYNDLQMSFLSNSAVEKPEITKMT